MGCGMSMVKVNHLNEIRMVLLGKTGNGKSATGNTILNGNFFQSLPSGSSVTRCCHSEKAQRFDCIIQVVDTLGMFDMNMSEQNLKLEICKCVALSSPGPHCFLLILRIGRFTEEDERTLNNFVRYFGNDVFKFFIIVFTGKDFLDNNKMSLEDYLKDIPDNLRDIIDKCNNRYIAFNNIDKGTGREKQVVHLLEIMCDMHRANQRNFYSDELYQAAEKAMQELELEIMKQREKEKEEIRQEMKRELEQEYQSLMFAKEEEFKRKMKELKRAHEQIQNNAENTKNIMKQEMETMIQKTKQTAHDDETIQNLKHEVDQLKKELAEDKEKYNREMLEEIKHKIKQLEKQQPSARDEARKKAENDSESFVDHLITFLRSISPVLLVLIGFI